MDGGWRKTKREKNIFRGDVINAKMKEKLGEMFLFEEKFCRFQCWRALSMTRHFLTIWMFMCANWMTAENAWTMSTSDYRYKKTGEKPKCCQNLFLIIFQALHGRMSQLQRSIAREAYKQRQQQQPHGQDTTWFIAVEKWRTKEGGEKQTINSIDNDPIYIFFKYFHILNDKYWKYSFCSNYHNFIVHQEHFSYHFLN